MNTYCILGLYAFLCYYLFGTQIVHGLAIRSSCILQLLLPQTMYLVSTFLLLRFIHSLFSGFIKKNLLQVHPHLPQLVVQLFSKELWFLFWRIVFRNQIFQLGGDVKWFFVTIGTLNHSTLKHSFLVLPALEIFSDFMPFWTKIIILQFLQLLVS